MFPLTDINATTSGILNKLKGLYTLLQEEKGAFEKMALAFKDKQLQRTVFTLVQESNQYASEVSSQIYCLGGGNTAQEPATASSLNTEESFPGSDEESIMQVCDKGESKLLRFYKELLDEPFLFTGLRKMIQYQMDGFLYTISQLRLLQTSLHK